MKSWSSLQMITTAFFQHQNFITTHCTKMPTASWRAERDQDGFVLQTHQPSTSYSTD